MPYQPSSGAGTNGVYISKLLANTAAAFAQDLGNYAWPFVMPRVPVLQEQGKYPTFPGADWARIVAGPRGEGEESKGGGFKVVWADYTTELLAVHSDIGQKAANNAEPIIMLKQRKAKWCVQNLYSILEQRFASAFMAAAAWSTSLTGVATVTSPTTEFLAWNDPGSSPITDVLRIKEGVHLASYGFEPNVGALDFKSYKTLLTNPQVVDRVKFTSDQSINLEMLARYFELDKLVICKAVHNSAQAGQAAVPAYLVGSGMLLVHVPKALQGYNPQQGMNEDTPCAGATLWWEGMENSINGMQVAEIEIPERRIRRVELQVGAQMHKVSASLGGFLASPLG